LEEEQTAELLFTLASADRLTLLSELQTKKQRLTQLSTKISASSQETFKHLARLRDAQLIDKDSDGFYAITSFGKVVLVNLLSIKFLSRYREYLMGHDVSSLPHEFIERIGELGSPKHSEKVGSVLIGIQQIVQQAKEYVWLMADHPVGGQQYVGGKKLTESPDIIWRVIIPDNTDVNWSEVRSSFGKHKGQVSFGLIKENEVKVGIAMNEKMAGVTFMGANGSLDFNSGFGSDDPLLHKWCEDVFLYYWNKARKIQT
jgi:predicted transcriptional regulator